jgi:CobQ-like glutamine amidotransferase family enzyme
MSRLNENTRDNHHGDTKTKKCCICGGVIAGFGNNAEPVKEGRCCGFCNATVVIPARIKNMREPEDVRCKE